MEPEGNERNTLSDAFDSRTESIPLEGKIKIWQSLGLSEEIN